MTNNKQVLADRRDALGERASLLDQREILVVQAGIHLPTLELKLEAFAEVLLGERRYLDYVDSYQDKREDVLNQAEAIIAKRNFGLSRPAEGLVVPK